MAKKTIKDAVKKLPKSVASHIVRMFKTTGYVDLYDGNLRSYMALIEHHKKVEKSDLRKAERILTKIYKAV